MSRIQWIAALALAGLSATAWAKAPGFEGRVHYQVTLKTHTQEMDYACKGSKIRMDMESPHGKMAMILDLDARTILTLMDASKSYMVRQLPPSPAAQDGGEKLEPTGQTQTLLGYACREYRVHGGTGNGEDIWATDTLGSFMLAHGPSAVPAWAKELRDKGFFPLKVTQQGPRGSMVMEATKVEPMHLSAAIFEAPAGYTKMEMPAGMTGAGMNPQDLMKMNPQDRAKMLEKMRQAYGQP